MSFYKVLFVNSVEKKDNRKIFTKLATNITLQHTMAGLVSEAAVPTMTEKNQVVTAHNLLIFP